MFVCSFRSRHSSFLAVDNFFDSFLLSTQDIDRFCTNLLLVDNIYAHNVIVVDKLRKGIATTAII